MGLLRPKAIRMSTGQPADIPLTTAYHPESVRMALGWQAVVLLYYYYCAPTYSSPLRDNDIHIVCRHSIYYMCKGRG